MFRPLRDAFPQGRLDAAVLACPAVARAAVPLEPPLAEAHRERRAAEPLERRELRRRDAEPRALQVVQEHREQQGESELQILVRPAQGPPDAPQPERQDAERRAPRAWPQPEQRAQHSVQKPPELPRWAELQGARREPQVAPEQAQLELERRAAARQPERQGVGRQASPRV